MVPGDTLSVTRDTGVMVGGRVHPRNREVSTGVTGGTPGAIYPPIMATTNQGYCYLTRIFEHVPSYPTGSHPIEVYGCGFTTLAEALADGLRVCEARATLKPVGLRPWTRAR